MRGSSLAELKVVPRLWVARGFLGDHRVICQIAFPELKDKARTEVVRLIVLDGAFDSFTGA